MNKRLFSLAACLAAVALAGVPRALAADDGCDVQAGSYAGVVPARHRTGPIVALPQTPCATLPAPATPGLDVTIEAAPSDSAATNQDGMDPGSMDPGTMDPDARPVRPRGPPWRGRAGRARSR